MKLHCGRDNFQVQQSDWEFHILKSPKVDKPISANHKQFRASVVHV